MADDDAARIAQRVLAYGYEMDYAVKSALRSTAAKTTRDTTKVVAADTGIAQKHIKPRIQPFARRATKTHQGSKVYRAWMGTKRYLPADLSPKARTKARAQGAFKIKGRTGLWQRVGKEKYPIRRAAFRLDPYGPTLEQKGRQAWDLEFPRVLRRELRARSRRFVRTPWEAERLKRLAKQLTDKLNRERGKYD